MTTFDDRERGFENRFIHDEELRFKALARRNKAVADWASARMGRSAEAAASYRAEIVAVGLEGGDDDALADRIVADLAEAGHPASGVDVRAVMTRSLAEALASETGR